MNNTTTKPAPPAFSTIRATIERAATAHCGRPVKLGRDAYTARQWRARGEQDGLGARMVVTHEGGEFAPFFNWDYCDYQAIEAMTAALAGLGVYPEAINCWSTAIYNR